MKTVLIHSCCAHCAAYTVDYWRERGYSVSTLWYNPNIHPYIEHQHRLKSMQSLAQQFELPLIIDESYDTIEYFRRVVGHETERCSNCFELRLSRTADVVKQRGFDAFSTTLLISPHQKHDLLPKTGYKLAEEKGIEFLYADLRKCYSKSRQITKAKNLYRQQYCGCLYSELERFTNIKTV